MIDTVHDLELGNHLARLVRDQPAFAGNPGSHRFTLQLSEFLFFLFLIMSVSMGVMLRVSTEETALVMTVKRLGRTDRSAGTDIAAVVLVFHPQCSKDRQSWILGGIEHCVHNVDLGVGIDQARGHFSNLHDLQSFRNSTTGGDTFDSSFTDNDDRIVDRLAIAEVSLARLHHIGVDRFHGLFFGKKWRETESGDQSKDPQHQGVLGCVVHFLTLSNSFTFPGSATRVPCPPRQT